MNKLIAYQTRPTFGTNELLNGSKYSFWTDTDSNTEEWGYDHIIPLTDWYSDTDVILIGYLTNVQIYGFR